jgi:hypothetical protein
MTPLLKYINSQPKKKGNNSHNSPFTHPQYQHFPFIPQPRNDNLDYIKNRKKVVDAQQATKADAAE